MSRQTFYKYVNRFRAEGVSGLVRRSTRPIRTRRLLDPVAEDVLVRVRKILDDEGQYHGALSVLWHLEDHLELWPAEAVLPSVSTIHRVLMARGQVVPAPAKAPRSSGRRFQSSMVNGMWQMDGFDVPLPSGRRVVVIHLLDDRSRLDLGMHVARSENGDDVWTAFTTATATYGVPRKVLTDNGSAFSGARRGWTSQLEENLRQIGVEPITSTPRHPQTCGKVERLHQTAQRWLARRVLPEDPVALAELLQIYRARYNQRRHQSLGGDRPQHVFDTAPRAVPPAWPIAPAGHVTSSTVSVRGQIYVDSVHLGVGRPNAGRSAVVYRTGEQVAVFLDGRYYGSHTIDRTRRYQPVPPIHSPR
ncbi:DDE-type integrase/transposase/recombinase, partial [Nakamurella alba]|uniref:DDE-type integrase/transposase/recombinase n=1 Tax=Nakamurella alba TaxID=2665158 RepID=UPI002AC361F4